MNSTDAGALPFFLIEGPAGGTMTVWTATAAAILKAHPWRTEDPTSANLFFTTLETAGETNWPVYGRQGAAFLLGDMAYFRGEVFDRIAALPFQDEANRHVIFNLNPYSGYLDRFSRRSNFIFPSSSIAANAYRRFRDVSFPVNPILDLAGNQTPSARPKYFLTFRGADSHPIRRRLAELANGRDVIVELIDMQSRAHLGEAHAGASLEHDEIKRYADLMRNTAFALVPRGDALFSYRLSEALAAGAVPVIVADDWVLPFSEALDYREFSVVIPEARWQETLDLLQRLSDEDVAHMRDAAGEIYRSHFATLSRQINTLLAILHGWRRDGRWIEGDEVANPEADPFRSTIGKLNDRTRDLDDVTVPQRQLATGRSDIGMDSTASSTTTIVAKMAQDEFLIRCFDTQASKSILAQILEGKTYPKVKFVGNVKTVLDIGANIGAFAIFASLMYPAAKIHALEPATEPFRLLDENAGQFPNINVYNTGLFSKDCTMPLFMGGLDSVTASVGRSGHNTIQSEQIALRSADRWMRENGLVSPDIMKIDTEGCEVGILESLKEWLPGVKVLYLEYHSENDRLAIDGLLHDTHVLYSGTALAPHRGEFIYVARNAFPTDDARDRLKIVVDF